MHSSRYTRHPMHSVPLNQINSPCSGHSLHSVTSHGQRDEYGHRNLDRRARWAGDQHVRAWWPREVMRDGHVDNRPGDRHTNMRSWHGHGHGHTDRNTNSSTRHRHRHSDRPPDIVWNRDWHADRRSRDTDWDADRNAVWHAHGHVHRDANRHTHRDWHRNSVRHPYVDREGHGDRDPVWHPHIIRHWNRVWDRCSRHSIPAGLCMCMRECM